MAGFDEVSPRLGMLDERAFSELERRDPDAALTLLAEMSGATDERLRRLARALSGRVMVRAASPRGAPRPGAGRIRLRRWEPGVDVDVDASLDELMASNLAGRAADPAGLRGPGWTRPATAISLVLDRSGSMGGARLATAAVAAAAVALRDIEDYSVIAFGSSVRIVKAQRQPRAVESVVEDLLSLRGHGRTDLAAALRAAARELSESTASRRITLLLSDGRATTGDDPVAAARALDELLVLAPVGPDESGEQARALARAVGGRAAEVSGPSAVPVAIAGLWP